MKKQPEKKLGELLREWLSKRKHLQKEIRQRRIRQLWKELMGATIAKYTESIYLSRGKLYIEISSAPLRQELNMGKDKIKRILNEALGEQLIEEVYIK